jgi:hypothetical protein
VTDGEDFNDLAHDAIANEVRRNGDKFAAPVSEYSAPQRVFSQTVGRRDQAQSETPRGQGGELADVVANADQIALRASRPDDPMQRR